MEKILGRIGFRQEESGFEQQESGFAQEIEESYVAGIGQPQRNPTQITTVPSTKHIKEPDAFEITNIVGATGTLTMPLTANTPNQRSLIGTYAVPTTMRLFFDKTNPRHQVVFQPFTSAGTTDANFIVGSLEVEVSNPTGTRRQRILQISTIHSRGGQFLSGSQEARRFVESFMIEPGDVIHFYFTAPTAFAPANSNLSLTCTTGKV